MTNFDGKPKTMGFVMPTYVPTFPIVREIGNTFIVFVLWQAKRRRRIFFFFFFFFCALNHTPHTQAQAEEPTQQSTRLICQHCGRDYKDKSSLRVHNFKKHRHMNPSTAPGSNSGAMASPAASTVAATSSAAAALVATSVQMAQEESDARLQLFQHQLRLHQLAASADHADLNRRVSHDDEPLDDDDADDADPYFRPQHAPLLQLRQPLEVQPTHKRGAIQHPTFASPSSPTSQMSIDVTTRLLPVLNPAVDETGKRRRVGERFTPTPIGSVTKRSKATFLAAAAAASSAAPHAAASSADTSSSSHTALQLADTSADLFELDPTEIAKNLSMLNDLADVALASSRNP
jgi:hypothetical protein